MRIAGIDPGLRTTGYGLIDSQGLKVKLVEAGYIRTNPKEKIQGRLGHLHRAIGAIISKFNPEVMVLEKLYAHWRHPATAYALGQARGVICLAAKENNIELVEYAATRIKKAIVGKGHASKMQVQRMIQHLFSLSQAPAPADVSDALALAVGHSYMMKKPQ
ncbi:crossover junction endodeoxyribonuclease RuvC [bacterium]|nr:MAG: crossover junction endodeoxyribonuclease RuvC [bacterium]